MGFVFQLVYTGCLVLCYLVYFVRFVGSEEANRKGFPIKTVGELLPRSAPGEVWLTAIIIHIQQGTTSIIIHIQKGTTSLYTFNRVLNPSLYTFSRVLHPSLYTFSRVLYHYTHSAGY